MAHPQLKAQVASWFRKLSRRHVLRVALGYAAAGFVVIEGADLLLQAMDVPSWTYRLIVILVLAGLPIALALAWALGPVVAETDDRPAPPGRDGGADAEEGGLGEEPGRGLDRGRGVDGAAGTMAPEPGPRSRIAVLPFASIHPDREHDYFADGMTEELISALARIQGLDVIARTSVMRYRSSDADVASIASDLGVGTILEGSVRKSGDQLRVTVQLVDGVTQGHLWAEDYDRELEEIFEVQADIARHVARALELRLLSSDHRQIERAPTTDLEAYDLYLLGRHQLNRRVDEGVRRAMAHFQDALSKDPGFAEAHAGMADAYLLGGIGYMDDPPPDSLDRARRHAECALELDEELPEAHTSLGYASALAWDFVAADRAFRRAIELNPSHAQAHQWYAQFLASMCGRYEAGIREWERALELDPLSVVLVTELGWPYGYMGDHDRALEQYRKALAMEPDFALAHFNVGWAYQRQGRLEAAVEAYERALELLGGGAFLRGLLATAYAEAGREARARAILDDLTAAAEAGAPVAVYVGLIHEALGDREQAFEWLERAVERREPFACGLDAGGDFLTTEELRADPRFRTLARRIDELTGRRELDV